MADRRVAVNREPAACLLRDKTCGPQVAICAAKLHSGNETDGQITLPRNSRIKTGKTWDRPESKGKWKEFRVYRSNPEDGKNPRIDGYWINFAECGPMVLDGLIKIKTRSTRP
jgi:hypothetical protein